MGYAQHVRSPRTGSYYLGRYRKADRTYGTVKDDAGHAVHFERKRDAKKAADAAEAAVREGRLKEAAKAEGAITFGEWASTWYASRSLAASTMVNYKQALELHVLPVFEGSLMTETGILPPHVEAWRQQLRDDGYKESSITTYQAAFRVCLADAVRAGLLPSNPAAAGDQAGRGKRGTSRAAAGRAAAEKVITTVLGALLAAERTAVLSGRGGDFILAVTLFAAGLRLGEGIGLEAAYASTGNIRVEWQLSQVGSRLIRAIPKDGSRGDVTVPYFLSDLLAWQAGHQPPARCACHGLAYLFTGPGGRRQGGRDAGVTVRDVAAAAGVAPEETWAALADEGRVPQTVRARVRDAARELGWVTGSALLDIEWHWRHSAFERLLAAAASGWWPASGKSSPEHPVWLAGEWPGATVVRYSGRRAEWCWLPVARGLTPHGLRHSLRTWMEESGVPHVLAEAQLRHEQGGIDVYRHVTDGMRAEYRGKLQEAWDGALQRRGEMHPGSPVRVVDALLRQASEGFVARNSQGGTVTAMRQRR